MAKSAAGENAWLWCTQRFGQYEMESAAELFLNAFFFYHECKKKETQSVIVVAGVAVPGVAGVVVLASLASLASPSKKRKRAY